MSSPESGEIYTPSPEYLENVEKALQIIFEGSQKTDFDCFNARKRFWQTATHIFGAIELLVPVIEPVGQPRYEIARVPLFSGSINELRTYVYTGGQLQVANTIQDYHDPTDGWLDKLAENQTLEFNSGIHTPSAEEYLDFLIDLKSFSTAI